MLNMYGRLLQLGAKRICKPNLLNSSNVTQNIIKNASRLSVKNVHDDVYEPVYLNSLKNPYPQYEALNLQIKGYDYPVLESYQRLLHNLAESVGIVIADSYAIPAQHTLVNRLRPNSTAIDASYKIALYERDIQLDKVDSILYPIFLRIAHATLPEGVELIVQCHTDEIEERRYVPDKDLIELKAELDKFQVPAKKK